MVTEQWEGVPESRLRALALRIPARRLAAAEDVARVVLFLASHEAGYLTGINLPVAGGEVM